MRETGGARAVGASGGGGGGGGGLGIHAEGEGREVVFCGGCFGGDDGCGAEPIGLRVRLWLRRLCLPRTRGKVVSPRRFAQPARSSPLSFNLTCCGNWTSGSLMKAVFGIQLSESFAFTSAMSSIADATATLLLA